MVFPWVQTNIWHSHSKHLPRKCRISSKTTLNLLHYYSSFARLSNRLRTLKQTPKRLLNTEASEIPQHGMELPEILHNMEYYVHLNTERVCSTSRVTHQSHSSTQPMLPPSPVFFAVQYFAGQGKTQWQDSLLWANIQPAAKVTTGRTPGTSTVRGVKKELAEDVSWAVYFGWILTVDIRMEQSSCLS